MVRWGIETYKTGKERDMAREYWNKRFFDVLILAVLVLVANGPAKAGPEFSGLAPGAGQYRITRDQIVLENAVLACRWDISEGRLKPNSVV
ncbi:MAG: hypothetical protein ACYTFW_14255, partial [Planctomycetota bacterium]